MATVVKEGFKDTQWIRNVRDGISSVSPCEMAVAREITSRLLPTYLVGQGRRFKSISSAVSYALSRCGVRCVDGMAYLDVQRTGKPSPKYVDRSEIFSLLRRERAISRQELRSHWPSHDHAHRAFVEWLRCAKKKGIIKEKDHVVYWNGD